MNFINDLLKKSVYKFLYLIKIFIESDGHERTIRIKKNIVASFFIKGMNIAIGLLLVPLTIKYLNTTKYGIWITLSSVIAWFSFFDIGLSNGLRNRFAEALAVGKNELAKTYVSTTYVLLSIIVFVLLILFFFINPFLNWATILNVGSDVNLKNELHLLALIIFSFFCIGFILRIILTILISDQSPAKAATFNLYANLLILICVLILIKTTSSSLLYLGITFSSVPALILLIANFYYFNGKYKLYKPSFSFVDFSKAKDLFSLSFCFFLIQISGIVLYTTDNIIISHLFSPADVTPYQIVYKYFGSITLVFAIIASPYWSAITEAYKKNEISWIENSIKSLKYIWLLTVSLTFLMLIFSNKFYDIWIGKEVSSIPFYLSAAWAVFVSTQTLHSIYVTFVNGLGIIKLQTYLSVFSAIMNVPLSILLAKYLGLGITGVIVATTITQMLSLLLSYIQYRKLINQRAVGIWAK